MSQINLLPWREKARRKKTRDFTAFAALVAITAIVIVGGVSFQVGTLVDHQKARNQFLENEIAILKTKLEKIKELEKTKQNLLARMNVVQQLQRSRPEIVHLFEELVITVPEGVWITSVKQSGNSLRIAGKAESNARVSAYMRNIDASDWLKDPVFGGIEGEKEDRIAKFTLETKQESPNQQAEDGE